MIDLNEMTEFLKTLARDKSEGIPMIFIFMRGLQRGWRREDIMESLRELHKQNKIVMTSNFKILIIGK